MSADKTQTTDEKNSIDKQHLLDTVKQLEDQIGDLKVELGKTSRIPSKAIGVAFIIPGGLSLAYSILNNSQVLAFIGLSLTFWGALFFFVTPTRYVKSSLQESTTTSLYNTIDRIINDLKYEGKSYYIPPYPKGVYLPEHLKGLKDLVTYISADSSAGIPSIEELAQRKFLIENPKGICVSPPGLGLIALLEKESRINIAKADLNELCETLPAVIVENFQLAKEIEMRCEENRVHMKIIDSMYKKLYSGEESSKSVHSIGCPIVSAVACAIAKTTGKAVTIDREATSSDGLTTEVSYSILEG